MAICKLEGTLTNPGENATFAAFENVFAAQWGRGFKDHYLAKVFGPLELFDLLPQTGNLIFFKK